MVVFGRCILLTLVYLAVLWTFRTGDWDCGIHFQLKHFYSMLYLFTTLSAPLPPSQLNRTVPCKTLMGFIWIMIWINMNIWIMIQINACTAPLNHVFNCGVYSYLEQWFLQFNHVFFICPPVGNLMRRPNIPCIFLWETFINVNNLNH